MIRVFSETADASSVMLLFSLCALAGVAFNICVSPGLSRLFPGVHAKHSQPLSPPSKVTPTFFGVCCKCIALHGTKIWIRSSMLAKQNTTDEAGYIIETTFLRDLQAGSPRSSCQQNWLPAGLSPRLAEAAFLLCAHLPFSLYTCACAHEVCSPSHERTCPAGFSSTLMLLFVFAHLLEGPVSTLKVRASKCGL